MFGNWQQNTQQNTGGNLFASAATGGFGQQQSAANPFGNNGAVQGQGLFGAAQPNTGNSLFGGAAGFGAQNQASIPLAPVPLNNTGFGGMGAMQNNTMGGGQPQGGMFGQNQGGGGLFGSGPQQPMGQPTNNMFGQATNTSNSLFGAPVGSGGFGNQAQNQGSANIFGQKPQTGAPGLFGQPAMNTPSFGGQTNLAGGSFLGQQQQQPAATNMFGQQTNAVGGMFGQQNNMNKTSGFLNTPTNTQTGFGFGGAPALGGGTGIGGLGGVGNNLGGFGANNMNNGAKPFPVKKFQPCKPRNDTISKEKGNTMVACITLIDEYHTFAKDELRVLYMQNPSQFQQPQQQANSFSTANTGFGAQSNTGFGMQNNTGFGVANNNIQQSSIFGNTNTFGQTQNQNTLGFGAGTAGTSMFGNTNTNTGFGAATGNSNSLFGANNNTLNNGNNILNQGNKLTASLFAQTTQPAANTTGNLFGAAANPGGNSLFGNTNQQAQQGGNSIFGGLGNTQAPAFGNQTQQNPSMFGNNNNTNTNQGAAPGGSLFGGSLFGGLQNSNTNTNTNTGTNLFGNTAQNNTNNNLNTGGSLFNMPSVQQAIGGAMNMFGQMMQQPQQQQQQTQQQTGGSLFGSTSLFGGSLFGGQQNQNTTNFGNQQQQQQQTPSLFGSNMASLFAISTNNNTAAPGNNLAASVNNVSAKKTGVFSASAMAAHNPLYSSLSSTATSMPQPSKTDAIFNSNPTTNQFFNLVASDMLGSLKQERLSHPMVNRYEDKEVNDFERSRDHLQRRFNEEVVCKLSASDFGFIQPSYDSGYLDFKSKSSAIFNRAGYEDDHLYSRTRQVKPSKISTIPINRSDYEYVDEQRKRPRPVTSMNTRYNRRDEEEEEQEVEYSNTQQKSKTREFKNNDSSPLTPTLSASSVLNELPSLSEVPQCTKYRVSPNMAQLSRMNRNDLRNVNDFSIENSFGKIEFTHPVDLLNVDLDELVTIKQNLIEVDDSLAVCGCVLHFYDFGNWKVKVTTPNGAKSFMKKMCQWAKDNKLKIVEFLEDTGELVATYDK